jgi:alpha-L-fucosidase
LVKYVLLQEFIKLGQRVKSFNSEGFTNNQWTKIGSGTTIGYKRIIKVDPVKVSGLRINVTDSKACPLISNVEIY